MIRFCSNPACGRGFVSLIKAKPGQALLCPTCRRDMAPPSRLVGGKERREKGKRA